MFKEDPVQIQWKRTHRIVKRGVMINDLLWLTIEDFFDLAYRRGLIVEEHKKKCQNSSETHCNITAETKSGTEDFPDSDLFQWIGEATSLVIAPEDEMNFKADLWDDLSRVYNLASSTRINMLRLLHDRTGHGNENMFIAAHKGRLITLEWNLLTKNWEGMRSMTNHCVTFVQEQRLPECHSTNCTRFKARKLETKSYATLLCSRTVRQGKDTDTCWY